MKAASLLAFPLLAIVTPVYASCGAAFCTLNTDWNMQGGEHGDHPWLVDFRYESLEQNKLWSGSHSINPADVHEDTLERYTYNHNEVTTVDYAWEKGSVSVAIPYLDRQHLHIVDPTGTATPQEWNFSALGDIKLLARQQMGRDFGLNLGIKLPTGEYKLTNGEGIVAERALQPGSGSTDLVAGGFWQYHRGLTGTSLFVQALYEWAVTTRNDFRPGNQLTLSTGLRKPFEQRWVALLQLNYTHKDRDSGAEAEPDVSGLSTVQASPGLAWQANNTLQLYAFMQLPLMRHVNGIQLVADKAYVAGLSVRL